jgi:hypothetical protein
MQRLYEEVKYYDVDFWGNDFLKNLLPDEQPSYLKIKIDEADMLATAQV